MKIFIFNTNEMILIDRFPQEKWYAPIASITICTTSIVSDITSDQVQAQQDLYIPFTDQIHYGSIEELWNNMFFSF